MSATKDTKAAWAPSFWAPAPASAGLRGGRTNVTTAAALVPAEAGSTSRPAVARPASPSRLRFFDAATSAIRSSATSLLGSEARVSARTVRTIAREATCFWPAASWTAKPSPAPFVFSRRAAFLGTAALASTASAGREAAVCPRACEPRGPCEAAAAELLGGAA